MGSSHHQNHGQIQLQAPLSNLMSNITNTEHHMSQEAAITTKARMKPHHDHAQSENIMVLSSQETHSHNLRNSYHVSQDSVPNRFEASQKVQETKRWYEYAHQTHETERETYTSHNPVQDPAYTTHAQIPQREYASSSIQHGASAHYVSALRDERQEDMFSISTTPVNVEAVHAAVSRNHDSNFAHVAMSSDNQNQNAKLPAVYAVKEHAGPHTALSEADLYCVRNNDTSMPARGYEDSQGTASTNTTVQNTSMRMRHTSVEPHQVTHGGSNSVYDHYTDHGTCSNTATTHGENHYPDANGRSNAYSANGYGVANGARLNAPHQTLAGVWHNANDMYSSATEPQFDHYESMRNTGTPAGDANYAHQHDAHTDVYAFANTASYVEQAPGNGRFSSESAWDSKCSGIQSERTSIVPGDSRSTSSSQDSAFLLEKDKVCLVAGCAVCLHTYIHTYIHVYAYIHKMCVCDFVCIFCLVS
jgi:hypothetical protein